MEEAGRGIVWERLQGCVLMHNHVEGRALTRSSPLLFNTYFCY
jgi:hypothetical protein